MKKIFFAVAVLVTTLSLSSCTVNWFDRTIEVPWYAIAIPVAVIFVLSYLFLMSFTYICPHCGTEFKAKPYQLSVTIHINKMRLAKCPHCGRKGFCKVKKRRRNP